MYMYVMIDKHRDMHNISPHFDWVNAFFSSNIQIQLNACTVVTYLYFMDCCCCYFFTFSMCVFPVVYWKCSWFERAFLYIRKSLFVNFVKCALVRVFLNFLFYPVRTECNKNNFNYKRESKREKENEERGERDVFFELNQLITHSLNHTYIRCYFLFLLVGASR